MKSYVRFASKKADFVDEFYVEGEDLTVLMHDPMDEKFSEVVESFVVDTETKRKIKLVVSNDQIRCMKSDSFVLSVIGTENVRTVNPFNVRVFLR